MTCDCQGQLITDVPLRESYRCSAAVVDTHPATGEQFEDGQWWVFLTPKGQPVVEGL
jgi:hypothetical protein